MWASVDEEGKMHALGKRRYMRVGPHSDMTGMRVRGGDQQVGHCRLMDLRGIGCYCGTACTGLTLAR